MLASTLAGEAETERLARAGVALLEAAAERFGSDARSPTQLEAALREASVFVVSEDGRAIVARTSPGPSSGLVLYDLHTCLRAVAEAERSAPKRRKRAAKKAETADA